MPWCPKCGAEYQAGYTECSDCHVPLTDKPSGEPENKPVPELPHTEPMDPVLLCEVSTDLQAELLQSMLEGQGILSAVRRSGASELAHVFGGSSNLGAQLVVDRQDLTRAKEAIELAKQQPLPEEELARQAMEQLPDEELSRQAMAAPPQPVEDNAAFHHLRIWVAVLLVLTAVILLYLLFRNPFSGLIG